MTLDRDRIRKHLENFDLRSLFIEELGWDHGGTNTEATVAGRTYALQAVAHKRGMVAYQYVADSEATPSLSILPAERLRKPSPRRSASTSLFTPPTTKAPSTGSGLNANRAGPTGNVRSPTTTVIQENGLSRSWSISSSRWTRKKTSPSSMYRAGCAPPSTSRRSPRKFYDRFKKEHHAFLEFIEGIGNVADREWYASLMLNRMMFIYFIQKRGFLDNNPDYLRHRLDNDAEAARKGADSTQFLPPVPLETVSRGTWASPKPTAPPSWRRCSAGCRTSTAASSMCMIWSGTIQRSIFPMKRSRKSSTSFDAYQWHLDDRPLRNDNEINPDVLGYIFEKYINQKQMGAYYTKEDITGYISRNTVIPFLFDRAKKECSIAFRPGGGVWRLLQDDPDRYFHEAVRHGITYDIHRKERDPCGEARTAARDSRRPERRVQTRRLEQACPERLCPADRNLARACRPAPSLRGSPRQARRGEVTSINDLITHNLDIEKVRSGCHQPAARDLN